MSYFNHVCLVEAPQFFCIPYAQYMPDIIGICYLAAAIEHDVESLSIPENYYNEGLYDSFDKLLKKKPIEMVGISSMTGCFGNAARLAEIAKKHGACVVMGGFHPTALPEEVLKLSCVDVVVIGEGEETFRDLVRHGPSRDVKGIAFRENGGVVYTGFREIICDVDSIPFPLRSLRPERYGEKGDEYSVDTIYTSRGCPWSCSFCANDTMHKKWRGRSPENVVDEIALLHNTALKKRIKIWDANFLTNIGRVEKICDMMIERGLTNFRITTETRAKDILRAERILEKLHKIGLNKVGLGIESPNAKTLELMNKKNNLDDVAVAVNLAKRFGIKTEGYFIIGYNHESREDTMAYPEFARTLGLRHSLFMVMTPYPGTKVFEEYNREGRIKSFDWDLYNNFSPVIETESMGPLELASVMVSCDMGFATFKSAIRRNNETAVFWVVMNDLFRNVLLHSGNKSFDANQIRDSIFNAFLHFAGNTDGVVFKNNHASGTVLQKPLVVTVQHSPGKSVDISVRQEKEERMVTVTENTGDEKKRNNPVIQLDRLIRFAKSLRSDTLTGVMYRLEYYRNNPDRGLHVLFAFLKEPATVMQFLRLSGLVVRSLSGSTR